MRITFHGVRGSSPCGGPESLRHGGNTSCVGVDVPGHDPILLDIGTGARYLASQWPADRPFRGTCLLTHLHWDHVLGLPFFSLLLRAGNSLHVRAPRQIEGRSVAESFDAMLSPPFFPVRLADFAGDVTFEEHDPGEFTIGDVRVTARSVPHLGPTLGYRLDSNGAALAYISDHQQPALDRYDITDGVRELCEGADLLIHDAQFTRDEFDAKQRWGHCTAEYACRVAEECAVQTVALFHHDPTHDDAQLDAIEAEARRGHPDLTVISARERCSLVVGA